MNVAHPVVDPDAPKRHDTLFAMFVWATGILYGVLLVIGVQHTHVYNGLNAGVVVGVECGPSIGIEVKGDPGIFFNQCDRP